MHASMKSCQCRVYARLNQNDGNDVHVKCGSKAGQGGYCKHLTAVLYILLDFYQIDLKEIPLDVACTEVVQR